MAPLGPFFPKPRGDRRRALNGITFINHNGLASPMPPMMARTIEGDHGPSGAKQAPETLYKRRKR